MSNEPLRVANCSGFLGDRKTAAHDMVSGGPIDVLTGDYLAELTMAILARKLLKDSTAGYAAQFLDQIEGVLGRCIDDGIKIVVNAGGLNPPGLASAVAAAATAIGRTARIATVTGDNLMERMPGLATELRHMVTGKTFAELGSPLTANAYLGGWGIAAALERGADIVITGRVSDASLVVGPAAWHHGWAKDEWDALAGAVAAGHIIECGAQATGGNYAFFQEVSGIPGFPIAEVAEDGSAVITKHPGSGGLVSVGTVTAQLLYEIGDPQYLNPDVIARIDTATLEQQGADRVRVSGVRGLAPPITTKVSATAFAGYRNSMTFLIGGLDVEAKAEMALAGLWAALGSSDQFAKTDVRLIRSDHQDPPSHAASFAYLKVTVTDRDATKVGRRFSNAVVEQVLSSYPGLTLSAPPGDASPVLEYWPSLVAQPKSVVTLGEERFEVAPPAGQVLPEPVGPQEGEAEPLDEADLVEVPLGRLLGARSGDKGGDANLGVWARSEDAYHWMRRYLTVARLQELIPEAGNLPVRRYELPNLLAVNFMLPGYLGEGVASSNQIDPQAKGLGEYLRAKIAPVPEHLLAF